MPNEISSIFEKGKEQFLKKKYSSALGKFSLVVKRDPEFLLGWIYKVKSLMHKSKLKSALLTVDEALEIHNSNAEFWILKAKVLELRTESTYEESLNCCKEALRLNPNTYWYEMARIHDRFSHYKEALNCVDKALTSNVKQSIGVNELMRLRFAFLDALEYSQNYNLPLTAFWLYLLMIPPSDKILYTTAFKVKYSYTNVRGKVVIKHFNTNAFLTSKGMVFKDKYISWKRIRLKKRAPKLVAGSYVFTLARNPLYESVAEFKARSENFNYDLEEILKSFGILDLHKWKTRRF